MREAKTRCFENSALKSVVMNIKAMPLIRIWGAPLLALAYVVNGQLMLALPSAYVSGVFAAARIAFSAAYL